jgi:hypothetical protein
MKAIVAVVDDVYGRLEQPASVFLGADAVENTTMARVRTTLSDDIASTFWPPSARISGDPGASIALGRFNAEEDGRLSVVASFVQEDGAGRGCTQYTLDREEDEWVIAQAADAWPDCSISSQGEDTYHDALERARGGACLLFGRHTGTCGSSLYIAEANGYYGEESYFDLQTGLLVAKHFYDDTGLDEFVFGEDLGCERTVTESIPCSDEDRQACEAAGGVWRIWSRLDAALERPSCNRRASDAGLPCDDPMDCEGECFPASTPAGECAAGVCSEFQQVYGCFAYIDEGACREICVD